MASALEVAQDFAKAVGLPTPTTLVTNTADDIQQIAALINQCGKELASRNKWQAMNFEATFTSVAVESQGTLASIIGATQVLKAVLNDTIWDRTTRLPICGPLSPQIWQYYKALNFTGPYPKYRVRNNQILFNPIPSAGDNCFFEYASKCWCTDSTGATFRQKIASDTDIFIVDSDLVAAGLEWRWLRKKGLSYAEEFASYESLVAQAIIDDKPRARLDMSGGQRPFAAGIVIPIGSWPL